MTQKLDHYPEELLQKIAAGECPPETEKIISHAAQCHTCGPLLKKYLAIFSDEITPKETEFIGRLQTSDPENQREWVATHVMPSSDPVRTPLREKEVSEPWWRIPAQWRWRVALATGGLAAIIVAAIAVPAVIAANKISTAKKQVDTAFVERRPIALRPSSVGYAPYNPFPTKLGDENGHDLDEISPSLLEARSTVAKELAGGKTDPRWLQLEGRIFLWEATPASLEKAEKAFESARAGGLKTADLDIDLAATYFELDSRDNHPNLQRTLNLLSKVLTEKDLSKENRATALFNLAIAYEKTEAWDLAANTWKEYLTVDSSSPWASEARKRLKDAESRSSIEQPELHTKPAEFLSHASDMEMRSYAEEYQDIAVTDWLPQAVDNAEARQAGMKMAESMAKEHGDPWLKDMFTDLKAADSPAIQEMIAAIRSNGSGEYQNANDEAVAAAAMFGEHHRLAGEMRAIFEEIYAKRRFLKGTDCALLADRLRSRILKTEYHWLQARVLLENAECTNLKGDFAQSDDSFGSGREIAAKFDFPILLLRDLHASAGMRHLRADCDSGWKDSMEGLDEYWKIRHPSHERLFEFYAVMFQCALETGSLYSAEALIRHSLDMRRYDPGDIDNDPVIDGLLHLHLSNVLLARMETAASQSERTEGLVLLGRSADPSAVKYRLITDIEPAELQIEHGDSRLALETLQSASKLLSNNPDGFFSVHYEKVLGNALFRVGNLQGAADAYRHAINTVEAARTDNGAERIQWLNAIDESYRGLVRVLIEEGKQREALKEWELYKNEPLLQTTISTELSRSPADNNEEKRTDSNLTVSPKPEIRLVYAIFRDGLQIWVKKNGSVKGFWVSADGPGLESQIRDFSARCATEESNLTALQLQATKLYGSLLQPVVQEIRGVETLVVELDSRASNLPMEALRGPDGAYVGEKHPIVYSPAMGMEENLRAATPLNDGATLVFVDGSSSYLPGIDAERNAVSTLFPHSSIIDASQTNLTDMQSLSGESEIWHYTGHGRREGSGTSLDYNGSQSLKATDFTPKAFSRTQLVVLAACSSGRSGVHGPIDTNSLVHALLASRVPDIIASRWNVDSQATSQLMISFYSHLAKNGNVTEALAAARNEVLATHAHPYYWAGFSLIGRAT